mgnify:CR=1 FL=1
MSSRSAQDGRKTMVQERTPFGCDDAEDPSHSEVKPARQITEETEKSFAEVTLHEAFRREGVTGGIFEDAFVFIVCV